MECWLLLLAGLVAAVPALAQVAATIPTQPAVAPPEEMMMAYLRRAAHEALQARRARYEKLKTPEEIAAWQGRLRQFFREQLGEMPERTPLNAKVIGREQRDGYRVEKILFESRPNFHVAGLLYLPATPPPWPGVLVPCGHSRNGKAYDAYQRAPILLARNGMAAFCFDPIGQGERSQIIEDGKPMQGGTVEHTLAGVGSVLLGRSTAHWFVWDAMRALDYLASRPDIDAKRIGCTGTSGGGTQTSYLMALDDRVTCAVPCCYITSFERLIDTIGPQDAEQNVHAQIAAGLNHADYVILHAPRPALLGAATRDFFDIAGSWDSLRQAKRIYARLGLAERVDLVEVDLEHNWATELRVPMACWMRRWLLGVDEPIDEGQADVKAEEDLNCTPRGQVLWLEGEKSVFELQAAEEAQLAQRRKELWSKTPKNKMLEQVRQIAGIRRLAELPEPDVTMVDTQDRKDCRVRRLLVEPEPGVRLPALLFEPGQATGDAVLYLAGEGKDHDAAPAGRLEKLAQEGRLVLAVDLRGVGKPSKGGEGKRWDECFGPNANEFFLAYMLDKSFVGMRAEDALTCARFVAAYATDGRPRRVHLVARDEVAPAALHAAALEPEMFASVRLERSIRSWAEVLRVPVTKNQLINAVHGALRVYDLPDLVAALPTGTVQIVEPVNPTGVPIGEGR